MTAVEQGWQDIASAPYGEVLLVKNDVMQEPVRATRGYVLDGAVHPDQSFFTSVYTPGDVLGFPAGRLVCPTQWQPSPPEPGK